MTHKTYQRTALVKIINRLMRLLIRTGLAPRHTVLLTVYGRKSGKPYSTPVSLVEMNGQRWLVAPYGALSWVLNARAAGQVTLSRRGKPETVPITEVDSAQAAPVLKQYIAQEPITRPYFDAAPDSPVEAFAAEAGRHPVFLIGHP